MHFFFRQWATSFERWLLWIRSSNIRAEALEKQEDFLKAPFSLWKGTCPMSSLLEWTQIGPLNWISKCANLFLKTFQVYIPIWFSRYFKFTYLNFEIETFQVCKFDFWVFQVSQTRMLDMGHVLSERPEKKSKSRVCRQCGQHHSHHEPHLYNYVGEVDEDLMCQICLQPFVQPLDTPCGHTFCHVCIHNYLKVNPMCPLDRKPLNEMTCSPSNLVLKRYFFPYLNEDELS